MEKLGQMYSLEHNGFTIVPNVLNATQVNTAKEKFFKWYQSLQSNNVPPHGIYKYHYVGHQPHAWYIRTQPSIIAEFAKIWDTNDLVVSFDGCCYIPPNFARKDKCWVHTDQAPNQKGKHCIQGFVSLTANESTSFVVYDGSHLLHEKYFAEKNEFHGKRWNLIDQIFVDSGTRKVLKVNPGDLVLWDSRTFHENCYGNVAEERLVQYVCYLPKNNETNTAAQQRKRLQYFESFRTTSHWPYPLQVNGLQPQVYGDESKKINYTMLMKPDLEEYMESIENLL